MWAIWFGFSAFCKSTLYIWKFLVHILLKPCLKEFERYFTSMWNECNCVVVWIFFGFFGIGMKTDLFQSCCNCWVFQICCHIECNTFTALSFRMYVNNLTPLGIMKEEGTKKTFLVWLLPYGNEYFNYLQLKLKWVPLGIIYLCF